MGRGVKKLWCCIGGEGGKETMVLHQWCGGKETTVLHWWGGGVKKLWCFIGGEGGIMSQFAFIN